MSNIFTDKQNTTCMADGCERKKRAHLTFCPGHWNALTIPQKKIYREDVNSISDKGKRAKAVAKFVKDAERRFKECRKAAAKIAVALLVACIMFAAVSDSQAAPIVPTTTAYMQRPVYAPMFTPVYTDANGKLWTVQTYRAGLFRKYSVWWPFQGGCQQ